MRPVVWVGEAEWWEAWRAVQWQAEARGEAAALAACAGRAAACSGVCVGNSVRARV